MRTKPSAGSLHASGAESFGSGFELDGSSDEQETVGQAFCSEPPHGLPELTYFQEQLQPLGTITKKEVSLLEVAKFTSSSGLGTTHLNMFLNLCNNKKVDLSELPLTARTYNTRVAAASQII